MESYGTDRYGRVLGVVYLNQTNVNLELVRNGYAEVYRGKPATNKEPLNALMESFEAVLNLELEKNAGIPVVWKKNTPDQAGAIAMGKSMLTAFYESIDLSGYAVVDVELPLSAPLYTDEGLPPEFMLVGIIDLLLMDENSESGGSVIL